MQHICIKLTCRQTYEDEDVDDYYCPPCLETHKLLALEMDKKKVAPRPSKSALQEYDESLKVHGFVRVRL